MKGGMASAAGASWGQCEVTQVRLSGAVNISEGNPGLRAGTHGFQSGLNPWGCL